MKTIPSAIPNQPDSHNGSANRMIRSIELLFMAILLAIQPIATASAAEELSLPTDSKPFFVHRTTGDLFGRKYHSGFYCYLYEQGEKKWPSVTIYRVEKDKVIDFVNQGTYAEDLMERIRKIGLKPFDYGKEVESTIARLKRQYESEGKEYNGLGILDGESYEVIYELDGSRFSFEAHEPGIYLAELGEHSDSLMKLHKVYNELMLYYAQRQLHFK